MSEKTFLLGVGCQKGGTTWLHNYLDSHPQCDLGFTKEYHVFDVVFSDLFGPYRKKWKSRLEEFEARNKPRNRDKLEKLNAKISQISLLLQFYDDLDTYADYFDGLHGRSRDVRLVGDITPSYCVLKKGDYLAIRELLEARGFSVKIVFLMRDPVERVYSAVRMKIRRKGERLQLAGKGLDGSFADYFARPRYRLRTQYEEIVPQIEAAFDGDNIYFGFYETLFTEESVRNLVAFLGIDYVEADFTNRLNASPKSADLDPDLVAMAREFYEPTYAYCADRFGADTVEEIWGYAGSRQVSRLVPARVS